MLHGQTSSDHLFYSEERKKRWMDTLVIIGHMTVEKTEMVGYFSYNRYVAILLLTQIKET